MLSISCPFTGTAVRQNLAKTLAVAGQIGLKVEVSRPPVSFGTAKVRYEQYTTLLILLLLIIILVTTIYGAVIMTSSL